MAASSIASVFNLKARENGFRRFLFFFKLNGTVCSELVQKIFVAFQFVPSPASEIVP